MRGLLAMKAGRSQQWVLDSARDATDTRAAVPWCLRFFWEYVSELEGLSLMVLAQPVAEGRSLVPRGKSSDLMEEFWCVSAPDASTGAAVFTAVSAMLAAQADNPVCQALGPSVTTTTGCMHPDDERREARSMRASMRACNGELKATRLVISTQGWQAKLEMEALLDEDEVDTINNEDGDDSTPSGGQLPRVHEGDMAFLPFIRQRHEVRILNAELRIAVEGVLQFRAASALLGLKFKTMGKCEEDSCKLKRLVLPWMQSGTAAIPDEVLSGLVWGFSFGWPDDFSTCF